MTATTAIVRQSIQPTVWSMVKEIATSARKSNKLGLFTPEEAEVKMLVAWENNFPLTSAFAIVHIIENIPALSPKAVWAKVVNHPQFAGYKEEILKDGKGNFHGYRITLKRSNGIEATRQFTLDDAKRAKLDTKFNWQAYYENMCYWRAMGFTEDVVYPDVTLGIVTADALGAMVTREGDVIEGSWEVVSTTPQQKSAQTDTAAALNNLVAEFGAMAILEANQNKLPSTAEEIQALRIQLENTVTVTPVAA